MAITGQVPRILLLPQEHGYRTLVTVVSTATTTNLNITVFEQSVELPFKQLILFFNGQRTKLVELKETLCIS